MALLSLVAVAQSTSQVKLYCVKSQSSITYSVHHPLHSWTGKSKEVSSVILTNKSRSVISEVAVMVRISSFDSKNANRDSHAIEVTDALKYPSITFTSSSIKQIGDQLTVTGTLSFHGVRRIITFAAKRKLINNQLNVIGNFSVKMTQFKIVPPSLLGMATDDDIKISFNVLY